MIYVTCFLPFQASARCARICAHYVNKNSLCTVHTKARPNVTSTSSKATAHILERKCQYKLGTEKNAFLQVTSVVLQASSLSHVKFNIVQLHTGFLIAQEKPGSIAVLNVFVTLGLSLCIHDKFRLYNTHGPAHVVEANK